MLVAIPVAVLVMRAYPAVLGQLTRLARRRRGVVMVVGFARGNAEARVGALPVFALVLAFTVIAFAAMARDAVLRADIAGASLAGRGRRCRRHRARRGTGGSRRAAQRLITAVPGVERSATVSVTPATAAQSQPLSVILVDPRQYTALVAVMLVLRFPGRGPGRPPRPRRAAGRAGARAHLTRHPGHTGLAQHAVDRGPPTADPGDRDGSRIVGMPVGSQFAVLPLRALGRQAPQPTVIAVVGSRLDTAALVSTARRAIPGVQITLRSHLLADISAAPLPHGGFVTFAQGIAAVGAFSLLILMLTLVLSARSRELTMARLATMGLGRPSRGGSRRRRPCPRSWPSPWAGRPARWPWCRWSGPRWTLPPSPACR